MAVGADWGYTVNAALGVRHTVIFHIASLECLCLRSILLQYLAVSFNLFLMTRRSVLLVDIAFLE